MEDEAHSVYSGLVHLRKPAQKSQATQTNRNLVLSEQGLDCLDGTPLIDIKPDRCLFTPIAPPQPGDFQTG